MVCQARDTKLVLSNTLVTSVHHPCQILGCPPRSPPKMPMPKIPPISVTHKNQIAMVGRSAWRTACYGLLAAVCGTPLANGKP